MPEPTPPPVPRLSRRRLLALAPAGVLAALLALAAPWGVLAAQPEEEEPTIAIVTRHAERAHDPGPDPSLDSAGVRRARALATALQDARVAAAIVTQYKRTRETAAPLVERLKIPVLERPVTAGKVDEYAAALAREIRTAYEGRTVLVVGHSNTVPAIVAALSGRQIDPIPDDRYGDVYVVVIPKSGEPRLMQMRVQ
jgi:broad specificity phosphatase PhoE